MHTTIEALVEKRMIFPGIRGLYLKAERGFYEDGALGPSQEAGWLKQCGFGAKTDRQTEGTEWTKGRK